MGNVKYILHIIIIFIIQIVILDNIHLHSYVDINIYILAILILPYNYNKVSVLLLGFLFGAIMDVANQTMGVHAAAATFVAYLRPKLLVLIAGRDQMEDSKGMQKVGNFEWFFKYALVLIFLFNAVLILAEAFSFQNFTISLLRIGFSTLFSFIFILLYYFIALKRKQEN